MAKVLGQFSITRETDGYMLHVEDEDGETLDFSATLEQIEEIGIAVDEQLELDESDPIDVEDDEDVLPDEE